MSDPVQQARELIRAGLARFEDTLTEALRPQAEYLTETEYETYRRGKKLRPLILLLSARVASQDAQADLPEKVIRASVSLEMLHVATLIHDDIVDVAPTRRGLKTVYSERGTEMAVLIGDLQFIQAIRGFADAINAQEDMHLIRMVLDAGFKICCGEIDELMTDPSWDTEVLTDRYFQTVDRKTTMLFALACESGAALVGADRTTTFCLSRFGRRFGKAFQIMDDILDLVRPEEASGKAPGTDLMQGRLTLPIIYAIEPLPHDHVVRRVIRREPCTPEEFREAIEVVVNSDGLIRSYSKARETALEGVDFLSELPPSPHRDALAEIGTHVIDRGHLRPDT